MDDIYGDLENYNDVNVIDELRNENKELKYKIEEYAATLERLQKDFDKVSSDFKKLEINYSSLLKTARAEIERKTQIITNLNKEKDMMVLVSIQNSNKSLTSLRRNMTRERSNHRKSRNEAVADINKVDAEKNKNDDRLPSTETASSGNTHNSNKFVNLDNKINKLDTFVNETKENLKSKRPQGLKHRRKSMPVTSKHPKFSSDEEYEGICSEEDTPRERPGNEKNRKNFDRHKQTHKVSETSGIDEKYSSYHESSRETYYKGRPHRYSDKYKNARDRYEPQRLKGPYSPEVRRRDCPNDQHQRQDYSRKRVLKTPTVEAYDLQQRYRDRRFKYQREHVRDKAVTEKLMPIKHKAPPDCQGPPNKRPRGKSGSVPHDENVQRNIEENKQSKDCDPQSTHKKMILNLPENMEPSSCESPDYTVPETSTIATQPIKEIMNTAETILEDPRLSNKKYIKEITGNKTILSTVTGRNINLKPIDVSKWDVVTVEIPKALQNPPEDDNKTVQELYSNIENPTLSNLSMESGDLQSETNDGTLVDFVTKSFLRDYEIEANNLKTLSNDKINVFEKFGNSFDDTRSGFDKITSKDIIAENDKQGNDITNSNVNAHCENNNTCKDQTPTKADTTNPLGILLQQLHSVCGVDVTSKSNKSKLDVDKTYETDVAQIRNRKITRKERELTKQLPTLRSASKLSSIEIVEGDLALSDETSDNIEHQKSTKNSILKKENNSCKFESNKINIDNVNVESSIGVEAKKKTSESENSVTNENNAKKTRRKSKRENVEIDTEKKIDKENAKKTKPKKVKDSKVKAKFNYLFGDSSSLITPEDLGVAAVQPTVDPVQKYVPIFEDAQDAIDVNVKVPEDTQIQSLKLSEDSSTIVKVPENIQLNSEKAFLGAPTDSFGGMKSGDEMCVIEQDRPLNSEVNFATATKEPDNLKTEIISTGVQPRFVEASVADDANENNLLAENKNSLLALATSTPCKNSLLLQTEIEPNTSREVVQNDNTSSVVSSQPSLSLETRKDCDVPDVRIFVKRRRKIKKVSC